MFVVLLGLNLHNMEINTTAWSRYFLHVFREDNESELDMFNRVIDRCVKGNMIALRICRLSEKKYRVEACRRDTPDAVLASFHSGELGSEITIEQIG